MFIGYLTSPKLEFFVVHNSVLCNLFKNKQLNFFVSMFTKQSQGYRFFLTKIYFFNYRGYNYIFSNIFSVNIKLILVRIRILKIVFRYIFIFKWILLISSLWSLNMFTFYCIYFISVQFYNIRWKALFNKHNETSFVSQLFFLYSPIT